MGYSMGICIIDWETTGIYLGVISTIISPLLVSIYIYKKWHDQKGNEVIANEAKEAYKELLSNLFETTVIISHIEINNITKIDIENFINLRNSSNELLKKLLLIDSCIVIENFATDINKFEKNNTEILKKLNTIVFEDNSNNCNFTTIIKQLEYREKINRECCMNLIRQLQPYTLFRRNIIFKNI